MILIVSFPNNEHVDEVRQPPHRRVDRRRYRLVPGVAGAVRGDDPRAGEAGIRAARRPAHSVSARWERSGTGASVRTGFHEDLNDQTARLFAWSEANEALLGVWYSLDCFWMNPPTADEVSQRKIRQLQVARQVGLSIPDTLVTNQPDAARGVRRDPWRGARRAQGVSEHRAGAARNPPAAAEDLSLLDAVRYTPVIFQRFVPADLDLRVTVVEDEIFTAAISSEPQYAADYRPGLGSAKVAPFELPSSVAEKLLELMKIFGLNFGAIDLRVTPEGDYVFLEVNPAGEYLFISHRTDQPIPAAIAASLERHDRARKRCGPC